MGSDIAIVSFTSSEADALPQGISPANVSTGVATLTAAMAEGKESAYTEFFEHYFDRLFRYLLALTRGDDSSAKDALQDTLTRVARHVRRFDEEKAFWDWLTVLARSAARDLGRKQNRYRNLLARFWEGSESEPCSPASEARLDEALDAGLRELTAEDRCLLEKKYFDRCTVRELARELRTTEKAIESRLLRARRHLRVTINRHLNHEQEDESRTALG